MNDFGMAFARHIISSHLTLLSLTIHHPHTTFPHHFSTPLQQTTPTNPFNTSQHPDTCMVINFASFRSVYETVHDCLEHSEQIKTIAIIAEVRNSLM
jgi:hypothetical protein